MKVTKRASRRIFGSNPEKRDAQVIQPFEHEELPEPDDAMLSRASINRGGRPKTHNPKKLITLRLPAGVIDRWRATGSGWQTRMAERLSRAPATSAKKRSATVH
jgi:uncharacterized protein (DUF4415 family)